MRALLMNEEIRSRIRQAIEQATARPIPMRVLEEAIKTGKRGDEWKSFGVEVPIGYSCAFSVEFQPIGLVRRLSISVDTAGKIPNVPAVQILLEAFGFEGIDLNKQQIPELVKIWPEEFRPGHTAINIIQPILDVKGNA